MGYDPKNNIHAGHRERLRSSFAEHGADSFQTHQLLELLLFYAIPYRDTNPTAHELISRFGSLKGVFRASIKELEEVPGVGRGAAVMLKLAIDCAADYLSSDRKQNLHFDSIQRIGEYLVDFYGNTSEEFVTLMLLDNGRSLVSCHKIFSGKISSAALRPSTLIEHAILYNASSAVVAHNHPNGIALPNKDDLDTTHDFAIAFATSGITLVDHIIVANNDFCSIVKREPTLFLSADNLLEDRKGQK